MARPVELLARVVGAGLLGATAGIHLHLWTLGYREVSVIGPLFLLNGICGAVLCLAVLASPRRLVRWPAAAGAGLEAGTLVGLVIAVTHGLFGFTETTRAELFWQSVAVEIAGTVVLGSLALLSLRRTTAAAPRRHTAPVAHVG